MDCCGNTFRRARTSLAMIAETFRLLPMHSTTGPAKHSGGEHRRKCLPTNYTQAHDTVLRRQVESALRISIAVADHIFQIQDAIFPMRPDRMSLESNTIEVVWW